MSERQRAFTIKTNKLSQTVYDKLEEKAKGRQLGDYVESLVMRDLLGENNSNNTNESTTQEMLKAINNQLVELKQMAFTSGVNPVSNSVEEDWEETVQVEGQIVELSEVQGDLDEEDLEEYTDF